MKISRGTSFVAACVASISLAQAAEFGIGFDFTLDYSVASIHFTNGTWADIAKVQGGPSYRRLMRELGVSSNEIQGPPSLRKKAFEPRRERDRAKYTDRGFQLPVGLQGIGDYLPSWLGGGSQDPTTQTFTRMLKTLKIASESYLETTSIDAAEVVFPFPVSDSYLDALRSAASSLSLELPLSRQPPAGILAARAHNIGNHNCDDDILEQLVLAVEYTGAAFTALLAVEDCAVWEYRRILHNTELRSGHSSKADLVEALKKISHLPLKDGNGEGIMSLSNIVLFGESADDHLLHAALKDVLRKQYQDLVVTVTDEHRRAIDPLFAASRGVARDCNARLGFENEGCTLTMENQELKR